MNKLTKAIAGIVFRAIVLAAPFVFCTNSASASPVTWFLNNATFDDGGTAVGNFTFDADTITYTTFNISVAGGDTTLFPPFTYSPATSQILPGASNATALSIVSNDVTVVSLPGGGTRVDPQRRLFMDFGVPLTNAGDTVGILNPAGLGGDAEFSSLPGFSPPFGQRGFTGGATAAAVPEPSSATLMILGVGAFSTRLLLKRKLSVLR